MKTLFISIGESSVARNIMRTDFWPLLNEGKDFRIVLVVKKGEKEYYEEKFSRDGVTVEEIAAQKKGRLEKLLSACAMNFFISGTKEVMEHREYMDKKLKTHPLFKKIVAGIFGRIPALVWICRRAELLIKPETSVGDLFDKYNPNLVFSTVLIRDDIDIQLAREAKRRKIKVISMTRSWDNLTTYGFIRIVPDKFIAQNQFLKEMAMTKHRLKEDTIEVVGLPHYDQYLDRSLLESKQEFFSRIGIPGDSKLILYGAVGDFLFRHEGELAQVFEDMVQEGKLPFKCHFVFRAHPAFESPLEKMKHLKFVVPDRGATYKDNAVSTWQMEESNIRHLINSLYHADVVVTSGSTFLIDGPAFGKPTITVAFDGNSKDSFWFSVARFYDYFVHIKSLISRSRGVRVVYSKPELAAALADYLSDPSLDQSGRQKLIELFAAPFDGQSSNRLKQAILRSL